MSLFHCPAPPLGGDFFFKCRIPPGPAPWVDRFFLCHRGVCESRNERRGETGGGRASTGAKTLPYSKCQYELTFARYILFTGMGKVWRVFFLLSHS